MCEQCASLSLSRRKLMIAGAAALLTAGMPFRAVHAAEPVASTVTPDEALARLWEGNARYAANISANRDYSATRAALALAQHPFAAILGCADSRVAPELVFDQGPGQLFIVRVAGNFADEDGLASLEYGAKFLGVPLIMVLGHSSCGAVDSAVKVVTEGAELPGHLPDLVDAIKPAVEAAKSRNPSDLLAEAIAENVRLNVKELENATPILSDLVSAGKLKVVGAVYEIATGKVGPV